MKTDDKRLKTVAIRLGWESRYRKGEHLAGKGVFLPDLDTLDSDFAEALRLYVFESGRLLEIGAGTGMQAIRYAQSGFDVTAIDVSPAAVDIARKKAEDERVEPDRLRFLADDILRTALRGPYDLIVDRGCYTLFAEEWMCEEYCCNVHRLLAPQGLLFLKTDAKKKNVARKLENRFRLLESWESSYHEETGPKAAFHVFGTLGR